MALDDERCCLCRRAVTVREWTARQGLAYLTVGVPLDDVPLSARLADPPGHRALEHGHDSCPAEETAFAAAQAEGRAMTLEQDIDYALDQRPTDRPEEAQ
jgi:hypothetical protein